MEFLPIIAIALLFWLLIIRPTSRRQKQTAQLQASVKAGDRVVLTSGFYGVVREARDDAPLRIELADGVVFEVARGAIGSVVPEETENDVDAGPVDLDKGERPSDSPEDPKDL